MGVMDSRYIGGGLAAIGIAAGVLGGYFSITTPEAQQCAVDLADARARLELLVEAKDTCKAALSTCIPSEEPGQ